MKCMDTPQAPLYFLGKPHSYGGAHHPKEHIVESRTLLTKQLGQRLLLPDQVHGNRVALWDVPNKPPDVAACDGLVVTHKVGTIGVLTADCVPIIVTTLDNTVAAALHAGWRGVAGKILEAGVRLIESQGISRDALKITLGPAALGCCYEVETPVVKAIQDTLNNNVAVEDWARPQPTPHKYLIDLHRALHFQAAQLGVKHIASQGICTICNDPNAWWSHRRGETGRNISVVTLMRVTGQKKP